jgi:hypothetical protein
LATDRLSCFCCLDNSALGPSVRISGVSNFHG